MFLKFKGKEIKGYNMSSQKSNIHKMQHEQFLSALKNYEKEKIKLLRWPAGVSQWYNTHLISSTPASLKKNGKKLSKI